MPPETPTQVKISKSDEETGIFQSPKKGIVTNEAKIPNIVKYSATKYVGSVSLSFLIEIDTIPKKKAESER